MSHGGARVGAGRKRKAPGDVEIRTIQTRAVDIDNVLERAELQDDYESLRLLFLRKTKEHVGEAAYQLVKKYAANEQVAKDALKVLKNPPSKISNEEALQCLLRVDLSRHQYQLLRNLVNSAANFKNLLPSYTIVAAQKAICMPRNPSENYSEGKAEVKLQDLLDHTTRRAVLCNEDSIKRSFRHATGTIECEFVVTWGGDSAGQQQIYQQKHFVDANIGNKDESLWAGVINPIVLKTVADVILWENNSQSHNFVRPFLLEYEKETAEYVRRTFANINEQIADLIPVEISLSETLKLVVRFRMICSLIDGKVFCHIVNVPFTSCPICEAPKDALRNYSDHVDTETFVEFEGRLDKSVQSLHARINMASLLIRIECRRAVESAKTRAQRANRRITDSALREIGRNAGIARKAEIIQEFRENDLHLTNMITGNMARLMLGARSDLTARILHIDPRIIERFRNILICINTTRYKLKIDDFKRYCAETRDLFLELYPNNPITPTLHKVLEHAADAQDELDLCLGVVSEGAAENQHRIRKLIRRFRARKTSRKDNLTDVFNRCLHLSDPLLSTKYSGEVEKFRTNRREKPAMDIPQAAQDLLEMGNPPRRRRRRQVRQPRTRPPIMPVQPLQRADSDADEETQESDLEEELEISDSEPESSDDEGEWLGDDFLDE